MVSVEEMTPLPHQIILWSRVSQGATSLMEDFVSYSLTSEPRQELREIAEGWIQIRYDMLPSESLLLSSKVLFLDQNSHVISYFLI